jgi:hypothetical protein
MVKCEPLTSHFTPENQEFNFRHLYIFCVSGVVVHSKRSWGVAPHPSQKNF